MDNTESRSGENRRGGVMIAAVIGLIAVAALAGVLRPQLGQAWASVTGPSEEEREDVRVAVERYVEAQDLVDGEFGHVKPRLENGLVTERYWSSEEGKDWGDTEDTGGISQIRFAQNVRLAVWDLKECCDDGASGVAEIASDTRVFDLEAPEDSSPFQEGSYKEKIDLVEQDGRWKIDSAEEVGGDE